MKSTVAALALSAASAYQSEIVIPNGYEYQPLVKSPVPQFGDDTPTSYDIRNIDGVSYASPNLNQHIPVYCGSCWAHGTTSALADRYALQRGADAPRQYPAIQVLLNCGNAGSCSGGTPSAVYEWIADNTIPTSTCQQYKAIDDSCTAENTCRNCSPSGGCTSVDDYPVFGVDEHGSVSKNDDIKAEIAARGPVACLIDASPIEDYTGGIFEGRFGGVNHVVSIGGYGTGGPEDGEQEGVDYWIVRNSWGEYWGNPENGTADPMGLDGFGWARISIDSWSNPGCYWATPTSD